MVHACPHRLGFLFFRTEFAIAKYMMNLVFVLLELEISSVPVHIQGKHLCCQRAPVVLLLDWPWPRVPCVQW